MIFQDQNLKHHRKQMHLDAELDRALDEYCRRTGRQRDEVVSDAVRRHLALSTIDRLRSRLMPYAEAKGYLTDEDVFRDIS